MSGLYIEVFSGFSSYDELLPMAKEIGFDGFFTNCDYANDIETMTYCRKLGDSLGLIYETSHSVIEGSNTIWNEGVEGDKFIDVLKFNTDNCAKLGIPILVVHVQPNFRQGANFDIGIKRFAELVRYAKSKNVNIAFENIGSPEFLYKTLDVFDNSHVGFCYDSGHEACCTKGEHYLKKVGNRLMCTHLHDNDNKKDLHMIPFDGEIGFDTVMRELKECAYKGNITLELSYDRYADTYSKYDFLKKSYDVARKIKNFVNS